MHPLVNCPPSCGLPLLWIPCPLWIASPPGSHPCGLPYECVCGLHYPSLPLVDCRMDWTCGPHHPSPLPLVTAPLVDCLVDVCVRLKALRQWPHEAILPPSVQRATDRGLFHALLVAPKQRTNENISPKVTYPPMCGHFLVENVPTPRESSSTLSRGSQLPYRENT